MGGEGTNNIINGTKNETTMIGEKMIGEKMINET
jgi:hypothetical protein